MINIAIDGPSGSGKGTTAKLLAKRLGFKYLDTGSMYRAIALALRDKGVSKLEFDVDDLEKIDIDFGDKGVSLNGVLVEDKIRTPQINKLSSDFADIPEIRSFLSKKQIEIVSGGGYVAEGRDISTVIMPDAALKIYLNASIEVRAKRRLLDFEKQGIVQSLDEVKKLILEKDSQDMNRALDPLVKSKDAVEIDTSDMTIKEQVDEICKLAQEIVH